jgi:hypothetical protein
MSTQDKHEIETLFSEALWAIHRAQNLNNNKEIQNEDFSYNIEKVLEYASECTYKIYAKYQNTVNENEQ